ncbi:MAG: hypothetical protein ISS25_03660 [Nanoarchaeota archaeon]|nr:hypothetical protein [Nanoarchaeota archaeon]
MEMSISLIVKNFEPVRLEGRVPLEFDFQNKNNILIISKDQSFLTHGVHKFPAKFFPELPRYLVTKYSKVGDVILDPMCGSGTVLLESILQNRHAIGVDIDPIAKLISKVKTTPIEPLLLDKIRNAIFHLIDIQLKSRKKPEIPEFNYRDKWFKFFVLEELAIIKQSINDLINKLKSNENYSEKKLHDLKDFLMIVFSSIIRTVSNADPHCTRTVIRKKLVKKISSLDTINKFFFNLDKQIECMKEFYRVYNKLYYKIVDIRKNSDARNLDIKDNSVDLVITSPPYANAVDYPRTHQLELYWLDLINGDPLSKLKRNYIGTETVFSYEYNQLYQSDYSKLNWLVRKIHQEDPRRAYILFNFFKDMEKNLQEVFRVLKPSAKYCVVIGNNTVRGTYVKSHEIITQMALSSNVGFKLDNYFHSGLINHYIKIPRKERMSGEWILIFKKS